jgi:hypothetical protein
MYAHDHAPPHLHAKYIGLEFSVNLLTGEVTAGDAPSPQLRLVRQWIELHRVELLENWDALSADLPPRKIDPLT